MPFLKKLSAAFLILLLSWGGGASFVEAKTTTQEKSQVALLKQIEKLLAEVLRLQTILAERNEKDTIRGTVYTPYTTVYFPISFESIYLVQNGQLFNTKGTAVRAVDQQIFDLFVDVVGESAVKKYVKEWRVFYSDSSDLGAFVELISGTDEWVVGVNRDNFSRTDEQVVESFANLFVHEYAHLLLFINPDFEKSFSSAYWTTADLAHAKKVEQASAKNRFNLLQRYYEAQTDRFVSDYATMNSDEDMAETFVEFVRTDKPLGNTLSERKILAFYQNAAFVKERKTIRTNLQSLGVL